MIRLALRRLWSRRLQALAPLVALLAATLGFQAVLVSARTTQAHVEGVIAANWNPPYDLLVRPGSLVTGLRSGDHLARPLYLDSAPGGISLAQLQQVRAVPGVSVAAPLAVVAVDYDWGEDYVLDMSALPHTPGLSVYRVTTSFTTDSGASHIPGQTQWMVVDGDGSHLERFQTLVGGDGPPPITVGGGTFVCDATEATECYAPATGRAQSTRDGFIPWRSPWGGALHPYLTEMSVPIVAVDPQAESALTGLGSCVTAGRPLTNADVVMVSPTGSEAKPARIPVILNTAPGFTDSAHVTVEAAVDPLAALRRVPATAGGAQGATPLVSATIDRLFAFHDVAALTVPLDSAWTSGRFSSGGVFNPAQDIASDTLTPVAYTGTAPRLTALPANPFADPTATYYRDYAVTNEYYNNPIDEAADTPFHALHRMQEGPLAQYHAYNVVGRYDPRCATRRSPLLASGFDVYADAETALPGGARLGPTATATAYSAVMPLLITNLAGGAFFSDPTHYAGGRGNAFISVIRVRVSRTRVPGAASEARLRAAALAIHRATGLAVDIVKGSSTQEMSVALPAGSFGRPALTVTEPWVRENVAIGFVNAINATTVVMSVAVGLVAVLLTMQTTYAAVRRRRGELVLLRALGWPSWRIALLMELEVTALGAVVGLTGAATGVVLLLWLRPGGGIAGATLLAGPAALALTALAGIGPAMVAARTRPLAALRGPGRLRRRRRVLRSPFSMGIREALTTWRWQTLLGALATAVGALFLGAVLAIIHDFHTSLDSTALAQRLNDEVGPFDVLLGVLALVMGVVTAVSVVLLATRERLPHFATLRALGWSRATVAQVVAGQAIAVGLLGGVLGAIALAVVANRVRTGIALTWSSQLSPLLLGAGTGALAAIGAIRLVYRRVVVAVLRAG